MSGRQQLVVIIGAVGAGVVALVIAHWIGLRVTAGLAGAAVGAAVAAALKAVISNRNARKT